MRRNEKPSIAEVLARVAGLLALMLLAAGLQAQSPTPYPSPTTFPGPTMSPDPTMSPSPTPSPSAPPYAVSGPADEPDLSTETEGPTSEVPAVTDEAIAAVDAQIGPILLPPGAIQIGIVGGLVQRCTTQQGPYTAFNNCTNFANAFHHLCNQSGITCQTVSASCNGGGHRFNMVQVGNLWYFVEPQGTGIIMPGFANPAAPSAAALCTVFGQPLRPDGTCPCTINTVSPNPMPINTNPISACALNPRYTDFASCERCCHAHLLPYYNANNIPQTQQFFHMCYNACRNHHGMSRPDVTDISQPLTNDSMAVAYGRQCVANTSMWAAGSRYEQCRGCCLDGARQNHYPRRNLSSCMAVCNAEYR
jgi:hypothetical protein